MTELRSFIGGHFRDEGRRSQDVNPARPSEAVADVLQANQALATEAVEAAATAFPSWRATPAPARGDILRKAADLLETRASDVGRDLTREEG
ncbi:MAG TPA: aldehyde dehydrogenase family protein, partial [Chloroflexota bacterium]